MNTNRTYTAAQLTASGTTPQDIAEMGMRPESVLAEADRAAYLAYKEQLSNKYAALAAKMLANQ